MAEPVIIPVQLDVTDIDMSGLDLKDAQKTISAQMSTIKKSIQDAFKGIDASAVNKPIESAMNSVKKSMQAAEDAQLRYNEALVRAGKSSNEYKSAIKSMDSAIKSKQEEVDTLSLLGPAALPNLIEARKELDALIKSRDRINPINFVDTAEPIQLEKIANAYKKVLSAQEGLNRQSEKFNQTVQDNKLTDDYNENIKQAEAYKKKLEDLDAKSKRMEAVGATDKQWEALRYDTEQVSSSLDGVIKKMREAVKTGKAFRFGDGNKSELSRQINSFAMAGGNRAGNIQARAMKNQSPYTQDYQKALDELDKLEKKIESIRAKSSKMIELGASKKQFESLVYDAETLDAQVDEVKNHLMNMVNEGGAFKFDNGNADAELSKIRDKSASLQSTLNGVSTNAKEAQGGLTALGATHPKLAAILGVAQKIAVGFGKVLTVAGKVGKVVVTGFANAAKVVGRLASSVGRVASRFVELGKRIVSSVKNINLFGKSGRTTSNDLNSRLKKLNRNILMFGFGFRTAYYAVKRLRTIFVESFKVMGDQFDEVGQPMMRMMEAFNRLKGSLATAFQPLVSVVMPILTRFMNYLSGVLESIGKFMATLSGQGYIYKAVAKDINSVAGAAKNANKELASYDKLEVIQDNNSTGVDYEKQTIGETEDAASSFANMVKEAWEKADFTSVGVYVTQKLIEVLDNVEKKIVPKVTEFVNRVLKSVNTFLTGFDATAIGDKVSSIVDALVTGLDWAQVGALFANLNNTVWGFLDGLVNGIDWANLGQSLAIGVTSLFDTLNLNSWVGMISGLANGITDAIFNLLTDVNWTDIAIKLGNTVNNLFTSVDLAQIGTTINILFNNIFGIITNFFATVDFEQIASSFAQGINNIFSGDSSSFDSAVTSINNAVTTFVATAIASINWENILDTLINGLTNLFSSAGKSMASSNNPLIAAFGNVFTSIADSVKILGPLTKNIIKLLEPLISTILVEASKLLPHIIEFTRDFTMTVLPVIVESIKQLLPVLTPIVTGILDVLKNVLTELAPLFDVIISDVLPVVARLISVITPVAIKLIGLLVQILLPHLPTLAKLLELICSIIDPIIDILEPIMSIVESLCDILGAILPQALEGLSPSLEYMSFLLNLLIPILNDLEEFLDLVALAVDWLADVLVDILGPALNLILNPFSKVENGAGSMAKGIDSAFNKIKEAARGIATALKTPLNSIIGAFESMTNGVIKGINSMIKSLNKLSFDVPDWVPSIGGNRFGFNLKEISTIKIPRLAQGAVIPPNKEFLAMLGDQRSGTNIEAPLDTIKQALAEVLAELGGGNREPIILQVNGRTLAKVVWDEQEKRYKQTGKYSPA